LDSSIKFLNFIALQYLEQPVSPVKDAYGNLLLRMLIRLRAIISDDYIHKQLQSTIESLTKGLHSVLDYQRHKVSHISVSLYGVAACMSGKINFLEKCYHLISLILAAIKDETSGDSQSKLWCSLKTIMWTYYYRYSEAWATMLERTESTLFAQIFPKGRRYVLGVDIRISDLVDLLCLISRKLPSYSLNEVLKRLVRQANSSLQKPLDNFPFDRALVVCLVFARFVKSAGQKGSPDLVFTEEGHTLIEEYMKPDSNVNDLDLKGMSVLVSLMINGSLQLISKSCKVESGTEGGYLVFDTSKVKVIRYLNCLLDSHWSVIRVKYLYELYHCNEEGLSTRARDALNKLFKLQTLEERRSTVELICGEMIGQLVNNQKEIFLKSIVILKDFQLSLAEYPEPSALVYFAKRFKMIELLPFIMPESSGCGPNEQSLAVFKIGLAHLLEYIHGWSTSWSSNPAPAKKISASEMEHYGRIADIYLELDSSFSLILKDIYREGQRKKNLLVRSWNSLVGYKKTSKEIVEFIMSLLDYPNAEVRFRIIQAFAHIPVEKTTDYLKRIERLRQEVSYDFVNLNYDNSKKNRRFELLKREVTMLCTNFLLVINESASSSEKTIMTPLRVIVRHLAEMYFFLIKIGQNDDFLSALRMDFLRMLHRYTHIVCSKTANIFSPAQRSSLLPCRFRWELWLTLETWFSRSREEEEKELLVACMSQLAYGMIPTDTQDDDKLAIILSWVGKLQKSSRLYHFAATTLSNLLLSSSAVNVESIFSQISSCIYEHVDDATVLIYYESISLALDEIVSMISPVRFFLLSVLYYDALNDQLSQISQNLLRKSFGCEALNLVPTQSPEFAKSVIREVAVALPKVQRPACQKRLLRLLLLFIDSLVVESDEEDENLDFLIEKLYTITVFLMETFDDDIQRIWNKLGSERIISVVVDRFVNEQQSSRAALIVLEALNRKKYVVERLSRHVDPGKGVNEVALLPSRIAMTLITKLDRNLNYPFLFDSLNLVSFDGSDADYVNTNDGILILERWLFCPMAETSCAVLFELCQRLEQLDMDFLIDILGKYVKLIKDEKDIEPLLEALAFLFESCVDLDTLRVTHLVTLADFSLALLPQHPHRFTRIITTILQFSELWSQVPLLDICKSFALYHPEALQDLLRLDAEVDGDRLSYYILGIIPQLLDYFENNLALNSRSASNNGASRRASEAFDPVFREYLTGLMAAVKGNVEFWRLLLSVEQRKSRAAVDLYRNLAGCLLATISFDHLIPFLTCWNERSQNGINPAAHKLSFMVIDRLRIEERPKLKPTLLYPLMESLRFWDDSFVAVGPCFEYLNS